MEELINELQEKYNKEDWSPCIESIKDFMTKLERGDFAPEQEPKEDWSRGSQ